MTPDEAVAGLTNRIMRQVWNERELTDVLALFDAVAATAKADETRRCAEHAKSMFGHPPLARQVANAFLRSGGLEVEDEEG